MSHISHGRRMSAPLLLAMMIATVTVAYGASWNATSRERYQIPGTNQARVRSLQRDPGLLTPADPAEHLWPVNSQGLTYGTPMETVDGYHEPDLMLVTATNGKTGYAYRAELEGPTPSSPKEALEWQAKQAGRPHFVPVYEADGATLMGEFVVEAGKNPE